MGRKWTCRRPRPERLQWNRKRNLLWSNCDHLLHLLPHHSMMMMKRKKRKKRRKECSRLETYSAASKESEATAAITTSTSPRNHRAHENLFPPPPPSTSPNSHPKFLILLFCSPLVYLITLNVKRRNRRRAFLPVDSCSLQPHSLDVDQSIPLLYRADLLLTSLHAHWPQF